jgi:hypothetical protein
MSENMAAAQALAVRGARTTDRVTPLDPGRMLQLTLAVIWLLDGMLQFQPFMFGQGFPRMLAEAARDNPAALARPVTWSAGFIAHHLTVCNALFAALEVSLGLGIALRRTLRIALACSVAWSLGVWWLGEGLGGTFTGTASPLNGAPGAVILYALLAVVLWPSSRTAARVLWLALWASMAFFALLPASRAPGAASGTFSAMAAGQPGWLSWLDSRIAGVLTGEGLLISALLAAALVAIAVSTLLPVRLARAGVVLAVAVATFIWLAEGLGGIFTGTSTDPNSGPLLALVAIAFWPRRAEESA